MTTKLAFNQIDGNVYNVLDKGVVGDGSTDITTLANALFTSISAAGGGTVVFPKQSGSYMVDASVGLRPNGNTKVVVEEDATIEAITNALDNYSVIQISNADNVTITGSGTIKGERTTHTGVTGEGGMCIRMDNSTNVIIEGLEITEGWGDGVYVGGNGGQCSNITIRKNRIHNNRRNNISVVDGDKGIITDNLIYNANGTNPEAGIDLEAGYQEDVTNWTVSNNVVEGNAGGGIAAVSPWGPLLSKVRYITISGNTVANNGSSVADGYGIAAARMLDCSVVGNVIRNTNGKGLVLGSGGHKIDLVPTTVAAVTSGLNATGNNISESTSHGIFLDAAQSLADLSNILVSGNTSNDNAGCGIAVDKTSGQTCQDITITGNTCKNNTLSGIYVNRSNDVNITGNSCLENTVDGIKIDGSASDTYGFLISSNLVKGNTEIGIQAWYANKSTITGNKILGNGKEGIYSFDGHDSTITANEISGNSQTTDATYNGIWLNRSDDCVVSGNLIRHDGGTNQHKYGIEIEATAENNLVTGNNIVNSGRTASILDSSGTSTVNNNLS
jgi:parallel beta-helix repeat protein